MATCLALGVVSSISIYKKKNSDIKLNKEQIMKSLNQYLDISKYKLMEYSNGYKLKIEPKYFKENIHELIQELYPLIRCNAIIEKHGEEYYNFINNDFNYQSFPLTLKQFTKDEYGHHKGDFYRSWDKVEEEMAFEFPQYWVFEDWDLKENLNVRFGYIPLWWDYEKIMSEDETKLLKILNTMVHSYYKSSLSKNILYYISG